MSADLNKYINQKSDELLNIIKEFKKLYIDFSGNGRLQLWNKKVYFPGSTGDLPSINGAIRNINKVFDECESNLEIDTVFNYYYAFYYSKLLDIKKRIREWEKKHAIEYDTVKIIPSTSQPNTKKFNNNISNIVTELKQWPKSQEEDAKEKYDTLQATQVTRRIARRRRLNPKKLKLKTTAVSTKPSSSDKVSSQLSHEQKVASAQKVAKRISRRVSNSHRASSSASVASNLKSSGRFTVKKAMGKRSKKGRRTRSKAKRTRRRPRRSRRARR